MSDPIAPTTTPAAPADVPGASAPANPVVAPGSPASAPDTTLLGGTIPPADDKAKAGTPTPSVPEKYDLKLPEGSIFDPAALEGISAFARELNLSNEATQKLVERDSQMLESFAEYYEKEVKTAHQERVAQWAKDVRSDKELGGEKFAETTFLADKALRMFATPAFKQVLNETGFGNHPELVRIFVKIGKAISEDSFTTRGGGDNPVAGDVAKTMFPSMN